MLITIHTTDGMTRTFDTADAEPGRPTDNPLTERCDVRLSPSDKKKSFSDSAVVTGYVGSLIKSDHEAGTLLRLAADWIP